MGSCWRCLSRGRTWSDSWVQRDQLGAIVAIQIKENGDLAKLGAVKVERKGWIRNIFQKKEWFYLTWDFLGESGEWDPWFRMLVRRYLFPLTPSFYFLRASECESSLQSTHSGPTSWGIGTRGARYAELSLESVPRIPLLTGSHPHLRAPSPSQGKRPGQQGLGPGKCDTGESEKTSKSKWKQRGDSFTERLCAKPSTRHQAPGFPPFLNLSNRPIFQSWKPRLLEAKRLATHK